MIDPTKQRSEETNPISGHREKQLAYSRRRAICFALGWAGQRPIDWILAKVRKRWPVASVGTEFEQRLRAAVDLDVARQREPVRLWAPRRLAGQNLPINNLGSTPAENGGQDAE